MALKIENKNRRTLIHKAVDKKDLDELRRLLDKDPLKPGYEHVDISGGKYVSASVNHSVGLTRHRRAPSHVIVLIWLSGGDATAVCGLQEWRLA